MRATDRPRVLSTSRRMGVVALAVVLGVGLSLPTSASGATEPGGAATDEITLPGAPPAEGSTPTAEPSATPSDPADDPVVPADEPVVPADEPSAAATDPGTAAPLPATNEPATDDPATAAPGLGAATPPTPAVEPAVVEPAAVEGQVLGWMDPLGGATVTVYDAHTGAVLGQQVLGEWEYEYHIGGLPPGDVKVGATRPGWVADFADNADTFEQARVFTLVAGQTLTQSWDPMLLYIDLTPGAVVEGSVVRNGSPVVGATVDILGATGSTVLATTTSDATGAFRIDGLAAGDVRVRASKAGLPTVFGRGGYPDANGLYLLQPYLITGPVVLDMSAVGPVLQGTVRGVNETIAFDGPLQGARVTAYDPATGTAVGSVLTDANGAYRFASLPATQVTLRIGKTGYLRTFAYGHDSLATADVIQLTPGSTITANEVTIYAEAAIEGQVLGQFDPLGGATLTVFDAGTGRVLRSVTLGEWEYEYHIGGLPAGDIKVRAAKAGYLPAFAGGTSLATADVYTIVSGQTLSQTWDEQMILYLDLAPGATVRGQVLGSGAPLADATVAVIDAATGAVLKYGRTDSTGAYLIQTIDIRVPGFVNVKIRISKPGWLTEYAPGDPATPGTYPLAFWDDITIPAVDLAREGVLVGSVLGIDDFGGGFDDPLPGVRITAYDAATGIAIRSVTTDANGRYRFAGLAAGTVKIRGMLTGWLTTFAYGGTTLATADVFTVQAGQTTTLDEFTMYAESVITGTTVRGDGTPLPGVRVTVYDATTGRAVRSVMSDGLGQFRIGALPWGDYKVRALLPGWITTFATGKASLATADVFTLVTGQTLDLTAPLVLQAEAVLTGQIMGFSVDWDDPLPGVTVVAIDIATGKGIGVDVTRAADDPQGYGTFRIGGLPAGQYVVRATKAGWSTTWAFDKADRATADVYTLTAGQHLAIPAPWPMFGEVAIQGQVLGNFDPLGYATVTVLDADTGRVLRSVVSDGDGDYRVGGLRARFDPIHIKVRASKTGWYTSWAEGRATESTATVYELRAGETLVQQWDPMVLYLDLAPRDL